MDACLLKSEISMGPICSTPTTSTLFEKVTLRRVANWDSKREKCNNCDLIYLKTLSQHSGFCSVDCKSNMTYLEKVNRTVRAMKEAISQHQRMQETQLNPHPAAKQHPSDALIQVAAAASETAHSLEYPQSFAEFDLEARVVNTNNVKWSFSAVY